jgi:hypothetical protein
MATDLTQLRFFSFPCSGPLVTAARAKLFCQLTNHLYSHLFSASLAQLDSTEPTFTNQQLHLTSLHSTELHLGDLGSSLYGLGADPTDNTASNNPSIVVMGGCLAMARILLTCLPAVTNQRMFLLAIVA